MKHTIIILKRINHQTTHIDDNFAFAESMGDIPLAFFCPDPLEKRRRQCGQQLFKPLTGFMGGASIPVSPQARPGIIIIKPCPNEFVPASTSVGLAGGLWGYGVSKN